MKSFFLFLCLILLGAGCRETDVLSPGVSLEELLDAPLLISAGGRDFILETFLWRDFMPISPPDGRPLSAIIWIVATDSLAIPLTFTADRIYIISGKDVWESELASPDGSEGSGEDYKLERIARNGPKWGPNSVVDVVVRLFTGGEITYLRASEQWIYRTD
jgi:hypothetical protein